MNIRIKNDAVEIDGYVNAVERLSRPLKDRLGEFMERIKNIKEIFKAKYVRVSFKDKKIVILIHTEINIPF